MDGAFYNDLREPHISVDPAAVTLATTLKALYPAGNFPNLGGQYFAGLARSSRSARSADHNGADAGQSGAVAALWQRRRR
jgi:hypothetical protein